MDDEILTLSDHVDIQNNAWSSGFEPEFKAFTEEEKQQIQQYYIRLIEISANMKIAISNNQIQTTFYQSNYGGHIINRKAYSTENTDIQQLFLEAVKILYQLRTLITGEKIYFLENIDGVEKVLDQDSWINLLSVNGEEIQLLEGVIKRAQNTTSLQESSIFNQLTQNYQINQDLIEEAGNFQWPEDTSDTSYIEGKHYQKNKRDIDVYAYWRMVNKKRRMFLLWKDQIAYNLGELYEAALERFEQVAVLGEQAISDFYQQLESDRPLTVILGAFHGLTKYTKQGRSVQGLKEGDIRTSTGEWVQVKRNNSKIASLTQVYNYMNRVINVLSKLTNEANFSNRTGIIKSNVIQQFANLYYSSKIIDTKIMDRIRALPLMSEYLT